MVTLGTSRALGKWNGCTSGLVVGRAKCYTGMGHSVFVLLSFIEGSGHG